MDANPIRIIWGYRYWLALFAAVCGAGVWFLSSQATDTYRATATVQVVSGRQSSGEFVDQEELFQLTNFYRELAETRAVSALAAEGLEPDAENPTLDADVDITTRANLQVLEFNASSPDPAEAAATANAYADAFSGFLEENESSERQDGLARIRARTDEIDQELAAAGGRSPSLETELQALQQQAALLQAQFLDSARLIQPAIAPDTPAAPQPTRDAALAVIAALVLGAAVAYGRFAFTDRYGSPHEAAEDLKLPLLATLPRQAPDTAASIEAFRILRTSISYGLREHVGPVLMITSAGQGSGKTHISVNIAQSFSAEGRRIVLVDCDFRRPAIHERLDIPLKPGMADLVGRDPEMVPELANGRLPLWSLPMPRGEYLDVIPAGSGLVDPAAALTTDRAQAAFTALGERYDLAVVDSPPALPVVDPLVLSHYAQGVLVVVDARRDKRRDARRAVETLRAVDAPLIGLVFNGGTDEPAGRYGYDNQRGVHEAEVSPLGTRVRSRAG